MPLKTGTATILAKARLLASGGSNPKHGAGTLRTKAKLLATGTLKKVDFGAAGVPTGATIGASGRIVKTGSATLQTRSFLVAHGITQNVALSFHLDPTTIPSQAIEGG